MIIQGSLSYDQHGRKRKRKTTRKSRSSSQVRTHGFHPCNVGSNPARDTKQQGAVAQSGERRTCTAKVAGSTPVSSTSEGAGRGTAVDNSWKLEISKKYTVAPAYNKGAYQVIPRDDVEHIGK